MTVNEHPEYPPPADGKSVVGQHWVYVMDVVFGGVIALGFEQLVDAVRVELHHSLAAIMRHLFVAACFFAFVIYDVAVYQLLIRRHPYGVSRLSALRYALDLIMAFCLLFILLLGIDADASDHVGAILFALSSWHVAAAGWHVVAAIEGGEKFPKAARVWPHFAFLCVYWAVALVWCLAIDRRAGTVALAGPGLLVAIATTVLLVSIYRSAQLVRVVRSELSLSNKSHE